MARRLVTGGRRRDEIGDRCDESQPVASRENAVKRSHEMKILLAYDGTDASRRAMHLTTDLAGALDASIDVISVVPLHPGRVPIDPWDDVTVHDAQLAAARAYLISKGFQPRTMMRAGDPASTIERAADDGDYDLVVVGSRGHGTIDRMLQGSVSEHVATHATTPVLVAR